MQVDGIEQQARLRRVLAQQREEFAGHVMAADHHRVEARAMFAQPGRETRGIGCVPAFHAHLLQGFGVIAIGTAVGRQEHHMRAFLQQQAYQVDQSQGAGIAVRLRGQCIDDQYLLLPAMQQRGRGHGAGGKLPCQCRLPLLCEHALVAHLRGLGAAGEVGAGAGAFVVDHHGRRLVQHATATGAHREREVGVFVVRRCIAGVEAAEFDEQRARDRDGGTAEVVGIAQVAEPAIVDGFVAPVVPAAAVGEHHAAGFLQAAIRIHQPRADQAGIGMLGEDVQQGVQPAGLWHGVVVQEHQHLALRQRRAVVAGGDEAAVLLARVETQAADLLQPGQRVVGRGVVHHDHLERRPRRMRGQCAQAGQGVGEGAVDRDDDAGPRLREGGQGERGERLCRWHDQWPGRRGGAVELQLEPLPGGGQAAAAQAGDAAPPQAQCARDPEARFGGDGHAVELRLKDGGSAHGALRGPCDRLAETERGIVASCETAASTSAHAPHRRRRRPVRPRR